jgi:hypothetical protein
MVSHANCLSSVMLEVGKGVAILFRKEWLGKIGSPSSIIERAVFTNQVRKLIQLWDAIYFDQVFFLF